jgi:hypothetical protein
VWCFSKLCVGFIREWLRDKGVGLSADADDGRHATPPAAAGAAAGGGAASGGGASGGGAGAGAGDGTAGSVEAGLKAELVETRRLLGAFYRPLRANTMIGVQVRAHLARRGA